MWSLLQDLRFGTRLLRTHPGFAATAVLTLALGIAANATVFSWIDAILLRPIAGASDSHQLAALEGVSPTGEPLSISYADFRDYQRGLTAVSGIAATDFIPFSLGPAESAQHVWGEMVSTNYFRVLGVKPQVGRFFLPEEDRDTPGGFPLAVISDRLWRLRYHGDPRIAGRVERMNGHQIAILGVAPAAFHGTMTGLTLDVWMPLVMVQEMGGIARFSPGDRGTRFLRPVVRLRPGAGLAQARAEVAVMDRRLAVLAGRPNDGTTATLQPLWASHLGAQPLLLGPLRILMGACVLVLLIACANVANLLLARAVSRQKEFGIRLALGSGRGRLMRQLLAEVALVVGAAAVIGIWLTLWMGESLSYLLPRTELPVVMGYGLNGHVLAFTIALCALSTVIAAALPAIYSTRTDLNEALKEGGRSGSHGTRSHRARTLLVVGEVALTAVALIGAGLFARSFQNSRAADPGLDTRNVLVSRFYTNNAGYTAAQQKLFYRKLRQRLEADPRVTAVSYSIVVPLGFGDGPHNNVQVEGYLPPPGADTRVPFSVVSPGYFESLHIPLLAGRDFTAQDDGTGMLAVIVNQAFVRRYFGGREAVGRKVRWGGRWYTVVGVAKDNNLHRRVETVQPFLFAPYEQNFLVGWDTYLLVRTVGDPDAVAGTLRREVAALDPKTGLFDSLTMAEFTEGSLYAQKVAAALLSVLGAFSLVLAAVGLYSVMAYAVSERTQEIGIRMAMGARPGAVAAMVLREGLGMTLAGLIAGCAAALAAARLVSGMLVGVSAADPVAFAGAAVFLPLVAAVACYLPARRATRLEPMTALRSE
jgi:predicted permease